MDLDHLEETIDRLANQKIPILGVVGVVGSTEEGSIDEIHKIIELRNKFEKKGVSFYLHVDAAYGGYARTMFLDENGDFTQLTFNGNNFAKPVLTRWATMRF